MTIPFVISPNIYGAGRGALRSGGLLQNILLQFVQFGAQFVVGAPQFIQLGSHRVVHVNLIHLGGVVLDFFAVALYHSGWYAHCGGVGGNLGQHNGVCRYAAVVAYLEGSQHFCAGADEYVVAYGGVALAMFSALPVPRQKKPSDDTAIRSSTARAWTVSSNNPSSSPSVTTTMLR